MPETVTQRTTDADVTLAAFQWWMSKRPEGWTFSVHLAHPEQNCVGDAERRLALHVAGWLKDAK